jgi:hypothetical protein
MNLEKLKNTKKLLEGKSNKCILFYEPNGLLECVIMRSYGEVDELINLAIAQLESLSRVKESKVKNEKDS